MQQNEIRLLVNDQQTLVRLEIGVAGAELLVELTEYDAELLGTQLVAAVQNRTAHRLLPKKRGPVGDIWTDLRIPIHPRWELRENAGSSYIATGMMLPQKTPTPSSQT